MPLARGLFVALVLALALPQAASAAVYRWVDPDGTTHYSDRIEDVPSALRGAYMEGDSHVPTGGSFQRVPGLNGPAPGQKGPDGKPLPAAQRGPLDEKALMDLARAAREDGGPSPAAILGALGGSIALAFGLAALLLLIGIAVAALFLVLACRVCREEKPPFRRAFGTAALQILAAIPVGLLLLLILGAPPYGLGTQAGQAGVGFLVNAGVVRGMLVPSFGKAALVTFVATVLTVVVSIGLVGLAFMAGLGAALSAG
jgi:hypothetical protein